MANDIIYASPDGEVVNYQFDFSPDLPSDSALTAIASGTDVTAAKFDGTAVNGIISNKAKSGLLLSCDITPATDGEEYRVKFVGKGATSSNVIVKILEVRSRKYIQGGF